MTTTTQNKENVVQPAPLQLELRDWFAGQAIGASLLMLDRADGDDFKRLAERRGIDWKKGGMAALAAAISYETADAMIAARKGGA